MTIPLTKYGHSLNTYFRYLTCLLDRGHITRHPSFKVYEYINHLPLRQAPFPDFSAEKQWRRLQNR